MLHSEFKFMDIDVATRNAAYANAASAAKTVNAEKAKP
jgi:hypothetical protein